MGIERGKRGGEGRRRAPEKGEREEEGNGEGWEKEGP